MNSHGEQLGDGSVLFSVIRDITDRREAQKALHQLNAELENKVIDRTRALAEINTALEEEIMERVKAEEHIRAQAELLDLSYDFILVRDLESRITYWNRAAEKGYGFTAGEAVGRIAHELLQTESPESIKKAMDSIFTHGYWEGELTHTRKDGVRIVVQSSQTLNRDSQGDIVSILEIGHDITEKKNMEEELARFDRLNTVGEMAAAIGHEVRNPLTTVRGYLQYYCRKDAFTPYREQLDIMIEELDRANAIITEFLSLAKNKAVSLEPTNLNQIIQSLVSLLQPDALLRGINLELELEDIPRVLADNKEMRQCILNLVTNAMDATPKGGTVVISTAEDKDHVILTVRDNGPGISPEVKGKLGTPFLTTKENGAGLGLAVCYRIAERHRAKIGIETGPEGTAIHFIFTLNQS